MDPLTLSLLFAAGAAAGGGLGALGDLAGGRARRYQGREMRELFGLRYGLGESFLRPEDYNRDVGVLASQAQTPAFGATEQQDLLQRLQASQLGDAIAGERTVRQDLAAMGLPAAGFAERVAQEAARARGLLANMANVQSLAYGAQANIRSLEQARQLFAQAVNERYGTLASIMAAGV